MFPAPRQTATKWLAALGVCCAGQMTAEDVRMKLKVYGDLLTQPDFVYTQESLRAAASMFRWFPSFAELDEFLGKQGEEIRRLNFRLTEISLLTSDEEIAARKAEEEAEKLRKLLETPRGRIMHRHYDRYRHLHIFKWLTLKDELLAIHSEEQVDAWHTEVAALDWTLPDINPLAELRARSRAALPEKEAEP